MNQIYEGGTADVETKIRDRAGDFVDPSGLSYHYSVNGSLIGTVVHGQGSVVEKVATGHYVAHLTASWAGRWTVEAIASQPQEVDRVVFDVLP